MTTVTATTDTTLEQKLPEEKWFIDFDFSDVFDTGVTLSGAVFSIGRWSGVTDTVPNMAAMCTTPVHIVGMVASQFITDGVDKANYQLKMKATGTDGSFQTITLVLPVVAKRLG